MSNKNSIQSPLGKAKGLGSAHHGTEHKIAHNITTLANIPLFGWIIYTAFSLRNASYDEFIAWMAHPFSVVVTILFVVTALKHFALELQVVFEDYIPYKPFRILKVVGLKIAFFALGTATIVSILKIAFMAPAL